MRPFEAESMDPRGAGDFRLTCRIGCTAASGKNRFFIVTFFYLNLFFFRRFNSIIPVCICEACDLGQKPKSEEGSRV